MPTFDIIKEVNPKKTFRVASIIGMFDLQSNKITERFTGAIDIDDNWQIGLIVGKSGTGKTTIAKQLFHDCYISNFNYQSETILDDMPDNCSIEDITKTFNSVGFSSPPSWLKPYDVLSNGEKMRVDLARAILENKDLFVFDEFTSVVDRNVAQIGSFAMQKAIRKTNKKFIAVTCHFDVGDWLLPDWIFNTDSMTFHKSEGQKKNRPDIKIEIFKTGDKSIWKCFARYHYLSHSHNNAASVFVMFVNNQLAGFTSVLPFPHPVKKNTFKEHRTVILPDYQGIGLSKIIRNKIAELYLKNGKSFITTTSSPALIQSMKNDKNWICTRKGRVGTGSKNAKFQGVKDKKSMSINRITTSWEYKIGESP